MSTRIHTSISLPQGYRANLPTLTAAFGSALVDLEDKVKARGLRPVWDTLETTIETDGEHVDTVGFGSASERTSTQVLTGMVSVLALEAGEAAA